MTVGMIGSGYTIEQVLADYPYLERDDVLQALRSEEREVMLANTAPVRHQVVAGQ